MHHVIGITPGYDGFIAYKWIIIWLLVCGGSCVAALFAPPWVKVPAAPGLPAEH